MIAAKVMAHTTPNRNKEHKFAICVVFMFMVTSCVYGESVFHLRDHSDQVEFIELQTRNTVRTLSDAAAFLCKYGYLRPTPKCNNIGAVAPAAKVGKQMGIVVHEDGIKPRQYTDQEIAEALRKWQKSYKLSATGQLSDETKRAMSQMRCGNPDSKDGKISETMSESLGSVGKGRRRRDVSESTLLTTLMGSTNKRTSDTLPHGVRSRTDASMEEHSLRRRRELFDEYVREAEQNLKQRERVTRKADFASFKQRRRQKRMSVWISPSPGNSYNNNQASTTTKFNKKLIRWRILSRGYSGHIPLRSQVASFKLAFRMWSEVIPLVFQEDTTSPIGKIDIVIAFARGNHVHLNCRHAFDGIGGEIAHSFPGGNPNPFIHLDDDEPYQSLRSSSSGIQLLKIVVHEIGHVLSLTHTNRDTSVMYAVYRSYKNSQFELEKEDRQRVQQVYGTCTGKFDSVFDWLRETPSKKFVYNTYFFRGRRYWLYENTDNRTRYGDPLLVKDEWKNVPDNIDAYAQIETWQTGGLRNLAPQYVITYLFFKGENVYKYDSVKDEVMSGWPKRIRDEFKPKPDAPYTLVRDSSGTTTNVTNQIPDNLDSVYYDTRDWNLYFFKGEWVWVYDPAQNGCCVSVKKFKDLFPPAPGQTSILEGNIDAAYYSYRRKAFYFFKGEEVWINKPYLKYKKGINSLQKLGKWHDNWFDICDVDSS